MGRIVALDENMINMIAAGEVIERPASVVKELTENSIDAGATKITITIEDGGRKLISITDNGSGMDAEDLTKAFEAHATSKIKTSDDLKNIGTLGFRGEALASIASVAIVKATSRTAELLNGNCLNIDCGQKTDIAPCSADVGTTITIRDLFYKLPARRKFLKTANTEFSHIAEQFTRIALANSQLDLTLIHNNREIHHLSANQPIRARIAELFSSEVAENLIDTAGDEKQMKIFALLGRPQFAKTNSKFQYVFLNGRFIRDKFITHAIKESYRGSIEPSRFPVAFIFLQMPYEDYDVNVHPTKTEVRFYNSNLVHSQILATLRQALMGANLDTSVNFTDRPRQFSTGGANKITDAMAEFFKKHRPAANQPRLNFTGQGTSTKYQPAYSPSDVTITNQIPADLPRRTFIQIHDSFIIAEDEEGFMIIDQHALHERILYEDLRRRTGSGKLESQKLLIPETIQLTETQRQTLTDNADIIERLGVEIADFGPKTVAVQAFPTLLAKAEPANFIEELADLLIEKGPTLDAETLLDEVLHMAACKAAVKAGYKLADPEIAQLIADKDKTEHSSHCPHGRPSTIRFSITELEKQFKRT